MFTGRRAGTTFGSVIGRSLGHRAPLLWLVLPFMAGLIAGRLADPVVSPRLFLMVAAVAAVVSVWASDRQPRIWMAAIALAAAFGGAASYHLDRARLGAWDALPTREVRLNLRVDRVFVQADSRKATGLATVLAADGHLTELCGQRLYFSLSVPRGGSAPIRSARISTLGVLVTLPRHPPRDSFDGYLASAGMNFRLTRGRVLGEVRPPNAYYAFCQRAAERFAGILSRGLEPRRPELASVLRAMLLGQKHELSDEHNVLFMRSGTMHLFAISGLHICVIGSAVHTLLVLLRLTAVIRFAIGLTSLWLYVDITGAAPSAVRAFIMVAMVETALILRVPRNPLAALSASAFFVLLIWPMQLFSASFQLSYAIVAALLLFGLPLADRWQERWRLFRDLPPPVWRWYHKVLAAIQREFVAALALGVASALVSTLGGLLFFKLFTPGAVLANLALIPASSLVILGGLASLIAGLLGVGPAVVLFNHSAALVLWIIDHGVRAVVAAPGSWHVAQFSWSWIGPASMLLLMLAFIAGYQAGWRPAWGGWWPPVVLVVVVLVAGVKFG